MGHTQSKKNLFHENINTKIERTEIDYIDDVFIIYIDLFSSL